MPQNRRAAALSQALTNARRQLEIHYSSASDMATALAFEEELL
jgi:hypothetical protein